MGEANWTPTGRMRWLSTFDGNQMLQQECEKSGFRNTWRIVPTVKACRTCDGTGTINGGLGVFVMCPRCAGEKTE